jgi:N-acetylglucosaminyldiphosphoundecaprenol N-acetyl-beta-D-mannosaminyltransferase
MVKCGGKIMFKSLKRNCWSILGLPFDAVNMQQTVTQVINVIDTKQRCFLSTPNLNFAIACQDDTDFYQSVVDSDLSIADGMPLIWIAKLLNIPITERVAGSSLFEQLSSTPRTKKIKVFFFGGEKGIAERALAQLNANSVGMVGCSFYDPGFVSVDEMSTPDVINMINTSQADFLVIALGAKKGQAWIQKNRHQLNVPVISHLGAVINFVAGSIERAPIFWQRLGLEWVWRIRQEPNLWRRYFSDGLAFFQLLLLNVFPLTIYDRWLKRTADYHLPITLSMEQTERTLINLAGSFHYGNLEKVEAMFLEVLQQDNHDMVELNCAQLRYIDSAFIAKLLFFQQYLNKQGRQVSLSNLPCRIKRLLRLNNTLNRFQLK